MREPHPFHSSTVRQSLLPSFTCMLSTVVHATCHFVDEQGGESFFPRVRSIRSGVKRVIDIQLWKLPEVQRAVYNGFKHHVSGDG